MAEYVIQTETHFILMPPAGRKMALDISAKVTRGKLWAFDFSPR